jgi:hypothetical protein
VIYSWLWRQLPGNAIVKISITLGLVVALILVLFGWVFPVIDASFTESPVVGS